MKEIKKIYWTIGEVANIIEEPQSRIRFWCGAMEMETKRNANLKRMFTQLQVLTIIKFSELSKTGEYTVKGMVKRVM